MILFYVPFGEILGESIGVWEPRNQIFLVDFYLVIGHHHQIFDLCLKVVLDLIERINFLLNLTVLQITVHIACGNVSQDLYFFALFRQIEYPLGAEIVDLKSLFEGVVEVNGGSAVHYHINLFDYGVSVFLA